MDLSDKLQDALNFYFKSARDKFDQLVEVSFVGENNYLQLVYLEKRKRSSRELKELEAELIER